jgi:hypothetical protein
MNDPIVDEVRRVREAHAAQFNFDLDAIFRDIKDQERRSGLNFVAGVARAGSPNISSQPTELSGPICEQSQRSRAGQAGEP